MYTVQGEGYISIPCKNQRHAFSSVHCKVWEGVHSAWTLNTVHLPQPGVTRGRSPSLPSASVEEALHGARATPGSVHGSHGSASCGSFHARRITTALSSVPLRTDASFHHDVVGLGRKISRPLSSHDMLKSDNTFRTLDTMMEGVMTLLWIPIKNRMTRMMLLMVKNMWFISDCMKVACEVMGSMSHCQAPMAVQMELRNRMILHRFVWGFRYPITSVRRRSKAFRSSQAVCSRDICEDVRDCRDRPDSQN